MRSKPAFAAALAAALAASALVLACSGKPKPSSPPPVQPPAHGAHVQTPRLVLEAVPVQPAAGEPPPAPTRVLPIDPRQPDPNAVLELRLTLINDADAPIEVVAPFDDVAPELRDAAGQRVEVYDVRAVEMPARIPLPPRSPEPPLEPGQRRLLATTRISRTAEGYYFRFRYGGVALKPGRYTAKYPRLAFFPMTREEWIRRDEAFRAETTTDSPDAAHAQAVAGAARFDALWKRVPTYFRGELASNEAAFALP